MGENDWRVRVDQAQCIGAGICASTAPTHFRLVDGLSQPLAGLVDPAEEVRDAADSCPMEAITVTDAETGDPVAPQP
ncbi:ferredoxin [Micromonospora sp. NPDC000207]|uniref:ferredoxin n=1 Tax=Micromonospora sp. NPDC000207 TaxID=3154246 RepID=UPI0033327F98